MSSSALFSTCCYVWKFRKRSFAGFTSFRWLNIAIFAIASWLAIVAEFRQIGTRRNYSSPSDIVSDRYHCRSLTSAAAAVWCIQLFIYNTAQLKMLNTIISTLGKALDVYC